jgi:hypothetical protein
MQTFLESCNGVMVKLRETGVKAGTGKFFLASLISLS